MICKEFEELTPQEKTTYIGQLVHSVQNDDFLFKEGLRIINLAYAAGLFTNVIINPSTEEQKIQS